MTFQAGAAFSDLFRQVRRCALHLEMRDGYMRSDPHFLEWQRDPGSVLADAGPAGRPWLSLMKETTGRGVDVRRLRVVSEPASDYIRFEHHVTAGNVSAGEQVRWLPRRQASRLLLPGNDLWLFDDELVLFLHFTGEGELSPHGDEERVADPTVIARCRAAFEDAWDLGVPHDQHSLV
ncbi:DUF6879 family protein [Streptomyces sp. NPDC048527]|uniref:DUF6879 family protein n=1 Tax=Streptomyces sp. NPDC048527 TaxID=3365568 RepID=UPI0037230A63